MVPPFPLGVSCFDMAAEFERRGREQLAGKIGLASRTEPCGEQREPASICTPIHSITPLPVQASVARATEELVKTMGEVWQQCASSSLYVRGPLFPRVS